MIGPCPGQMFVVWRSPPLSSAPVSGMFPELLRASDPILALELMGYR
jgi:hypothetical protein